MANLFFYGRDRISGGESNRSKKRCFRKRTCERVKEIYTGEILPICPLVKEVVNKEKFPNIPNLPKTSSKNNAIRRILKVFRELIAHRQPSKEFITWCAHRDDVLQDCMNLIEKDLERLPKWYEKDYPKTSEKLEKLIKRLYAEMTVYHSAHNFSAFMLPPIPDEFLKDYRDVLAWQMEKENPDKTLSTFAYCDYVSEMARLICHYPAVAIKIMNKISNELISLEQIEIEKAKHRKITSQQAEEAEQDGKDGQSKTKIPDYKALNLAKVPISRLIEQGESYTLEFKETLDYDTQNKGKNKYILLSSLKTIAGFLNAAGGTLLIGVDDSGKIKGIKQELSIMKIGNNDKFQLKIQNCLKDRFEPQPFGKVNILFKRFPEGTICRVDVQASEGIIHLDKKVYVREGNTTQLLDGRTLTEWIEKRKRTR